MSLAIISSSGRLLQRRTRRQTPRSRSGDAKRHEIWMDPKSDKRNGWPMASRCLQKVLCSLLTSQDRVFTSHFNYKINRKGGEFDKCKVRLVVQRQRMRRKVEDSVSDYNDASSPVPLLLQADSARFSLWLHNKMFSLIKLILVRFSFKENYCPETAIMAKWAFFHFQDTMKPDDPLYVYHLLKPLYNMPSAARAWHTMMNAFLANGECATVGFKNCMRTVSSHPTRYTHQWFCYRMRQSAGTQRFPCTPSGRFWGHLGGGCTTLLQMCCDERHGQGYYISVPNSLRLWNFTDLQFWNATPRLAPMQLNTRLNKGIGDKNPVLDFHRCYSGIVRILGYLVTMICPDLTWAYSEHSKYVQFPEKNLMLAAEHVLSYLRSTWNK